MQQPQTQFTAQHWLTGIFVLIWMTIVGGLPIALLAWLFYNADVGREVGLLTGALVASWLPLKLLVDRFVKDNPNVMGMVANLLPRFSAPGLVVTAFLVMFVVPVLWVIIAPAFLAGIFSYAILQQNLAAGLLVGLVVQVGLIYRNAAIEKERGLNSSFFVRVESMQSSFNLNTITIPDDNVVIEESITNGYPTSADDEGEPPMTIVQSPQQPSDS